MPTWLIEGFADYVGNLGSGQPVPAAARSWLPRCAGAGAGRAADRGRLRQHATPAGCPQAYEQSWLACRLIAGATASRPWCGSTGRLPRPPGSIRPPPPRLGLQPGAAPQPVGFHPDLAGLPGPGAGSDEPQAAARHQRLPAPAGRHPVLRVRAGPPAAGRPGGGLRLRPRRARPRSTPSCRSRSPAPDRAAGADPGRPAPACCGPGPSSAASAVWFGAAAPLGLLAATAAGGRRAAAGGHHPRARGRLGDAARRPAGAAPDRRRGATC